MQNHTHAFTKPRKDHRGWPKRRFVSSALKGTERGVFGPRAEKVFHNVRHSFGRAEQLGPSTSGGVRRVGKKSQGKR
jgi:hypothetical protein